MQKHLMETELKELFFRKNNIGFDSSVKNIYFLSFKRKHLNLH